MNLKIQSLIFTAFWFPLTAPQIPSFCPSLTVRETWTCSYYPVVCHRPDAILSLVEDCMSSGYHFRLYAKIHIHGSPNCNLKSSAFFFFFQEKSGSRDETLCGIGQIFLVTQSISIVRDCWNHGELCYFPAFQKGAKQCWSRPWFTLTPPSPLTC